MKNFFYQLLVTLMLCSLPLTGSAAPQSNNDITKPTRERVNKKNNTSKADKEQNSKKEKTVQKEADNNKSKAETKAEVKAPGKNTDNKQEAAKVEAKHDVKPDIKKDAQQQPDSAPKSTRKPPVNTDKVDFDGIDISKHQGEIDWVKLKKSPKIKYVYIKATEGSDYVDPLYRRNIANARKNGFKVGSYHFLTNKSSATSQFMNFAQTANRDEQDLVPIIDVEVCKQWSAQQLRDSLKVFADMLEEFYGCKPIIYTSEKFFTSYLGRAFSTYPLFIAKYNETSEPKVGYKWVMWQFTDKGCFDAVKGNRGEVDLSRFNKGCTINDIIYRPAKGKPKISVKDAVDRKAKPATINIEETPKNKTAPEQTKVQKEEEQKKAEKARKANERDKRLAKEAEKKKAKEKAEADKKAKQKADQQAREKARKEALQKEADEKAKRKAEAERAAKQKAEAEKKAKQKAEQKAAEEKAKRKAEAQKARQEKNNKQAAKSTNKTANLMNHNSSKMIQSQRNDSIRAAQQKGRKINKSSADND